MSKDFFGAGQAFFRGCFLGATALGAVVAGGCATSAHTFRLNPDQEPEQYRVTCRKRFYYCEAEAKELCGGEYRELGRLSNRPEQTLVKDSDVSSTGPAKGQGAWEGELTVECGRALPPLELKRPPTATEPALAPATALERVCIPGTTQACLGPGACNGAQACLESGSGFGPCDCGPSSNVQSSPAPSVATTAAAAPVAAPPAPSAVPAPATVQTPPAVPAKPGTGTATPGTATPGTPAHR